MFWDIQGYTEKQSWKTKKQKQKRNVLKLLKQSHSQQQQQNEMMYNLNKLNQRSESVLQ